MCIEEEQSKGAGIFVRVWDMKVGLEVQGPGYECSILKLSVWERLHYSQRWSLVSDDVVYV